MLKELVRGHGSGRAFGTCLKINSFDERQNNNFALNCGNFHLLIVYLCNLLAKWGLFLSLDVCQIA